MHWNVIDEKRQALLKLLIEAPPLPNCYLAGGPACALLRGHRISEDFDWFCPEDFDPVELKRRIERIGELSVRRMEPGTFHGNLDGIKLTWLYYPNPLIEPKIKIAELEGLELASFVDLGLMKWVAISGRGEMKDFLDLYELHLAGIEIDELYNLLGKKFKPGENYFHMLKSLSYFSDAEKSPPLKLLKKYDWDEIKRFFLSQQAKLIRKLIG